MGGGGHCLNTIHLLKKYYTSLTLSHTLSLSLSLFLSLTDLSANVCHLSEKNKQ